MWDVFVSVGAEAVGGAANGRWGRKQRRAAEILDPAL